MTYPPQPPGAGSSPQQPPGGFMPMPPPAYPSSPGGVEPAAKPSGGTAIAAGVLASLGGVWAIIFSIVDLRDASEFATSGVPHVWALWLQPIAYIVEVVTLLPGAILLLVRKPVGRWLVVAGSLVHIVQVIVVVSAMLSTVTDQAKVPGQLVVSGGIIAVVVMLLPAIATLVLALVPLTGRWVNWGRRPSDPVAQYPPSQPPGGQPGQAPPQW